MSGRAIAILVAVVVAVGGAVALGISMQGDRAIAEPVTRPLEPAPVAP